MPTLEAERVKSRQRSSSDVRPSLDPQTDWSPLHRSPRRTRSRREPARDSTKRPFYGNGTYRDFEEHQRWQADYAHSNALQPRTWDHRARSADYRRPKEYAGVLVPEPPARFDDRCSSDPQTPRFEEVVEPEQPQSSNHRPSSGSQTPRFEDVTERLANLATNDTTASTDTSDADDYEVPSTLLGQVRDCMLLLNRAATKARRPSDSGHQEAEPSSSVVADRCEDSYFRMKVWVEEAKLKNMPTSGDNELDNEVINLASSILYRLHSRAESLLRNIERASKSSSKAFSFAELPQQVIDNDASDSETSTLPFEDLTPAARIQQDLKQVELQIRTLRRLTRTLRVVQKDDFSNAVVKHVAEVTRLFGEAEDCDRWREEVQGMPGDAALKRVKEMVGVCC